MRKRLLFGGLALAGLMAIGAALGTSIARALKPGHARAVLDRDEHNWGRVDPGATLTTSFELRNDGLAPLSLGKPETTCGCAKPVVPSEPLAPGASTILNVEIQAPTTLESVNHFVRIPTNDPARPKIELNLYLTPWIGVRAAPQTVDLGAHKPGEEIVRYIQVYDPEHKPFQVVHVESDLPGLRAEVEGGGVARPIQRVKFTYRAGDDLGHVQSVARLNTDREATPVVVLPVSGVATGAVTANPSSLPIDLTAIGVVVRRTIALRSVGSDEAPAIESVEVSPPWKLVESTSRPLRGGRVLVDVAVQFPVGNGSTGGALAIRLKGTPARTLRIPLLIRGWTPPPPAA